MRDVCYFHPCITLLKTSRHLRTKCQNISVVKCFGTWLSFYVFQLTEMHYQITTACGLTGRMWFAVSDVKIRTLVEIGACRVGMCFGLCVGLCLVGTLLVGHSFCQSFLIGMGGGACCVVLRSGIQSCRVSISCCLCSRLCHVGLLCWLSIHFGGEI